MGKLSRKEREFLRHRGEILDVALELFSEKGFHNVTMQEVARESEFAVGTLYKFFANKEDLYKALFLEKSEGFHSAMKMAIAEGRDEVARIRAFVDTHIRLVMENLKFVRLYLAQAQGAKFNIGVGMDKDLEKKHKEILVDLSHIFKEGIQKRLFEDFDPYLLARALEGIIHAFLFQYLENPDNHPFDTDTIMKLFFGKVLRKTLAESRNG